jgi:hypothetical protein
MSLLLFVGIVVIVAVVLVGVVGVLIDRSAERHEPTR